MKFSEMPYKRPDLDEFLKNLDVLIAEFNNSKTAQEQFDLIKKSSELESDFMTMATIANIRNTVDTRDEFYEKEREFYDESEPVILEKYLQFSKAMLNSKFRKELEDKYGKVVLDKAEMQEKSMSAEIIPLIQEENKLCAEYQKLYASAVIDFNGEKLPLPKVSAYKENKDRSLRKAAWIAEGKFFDEHRKEFDEIFDKLVKNRTEQAKKLGLKSYVELGYLRRERCYGPDGVAIYRKQIIEEVVPIVSKIKNAQAKRIDLEKDFHYYDMSYQFKDGNPAPKGTPDEILAAGKQMYTEMSKETAEFIKAMYDNEMFDVLSKEGKAPGGYCTDLLAYKLPFIFSNFNGTSGDVDVLTHEAGHAFAFYVAAHEIETNMNRQPSMEGCETHSMSMEFLTSPWHNLFFKEDTKKYELAHAEDALTFLPYGTEVDNFQELVYSNPDWTPEQRNQAWAELEKKYRPDFDFEDCPFYSRGAGWQRQLHIYLYPFYYIDYCMAGTVALQFFAEFLKDKDSAWEKYLKFVRLGGTKDFVELVNSVGFVSPVEDGCLKTISKTISEWLDQHQI